MSGKSPEVSNYCLTWCANRLADYCEWGQDQGLPTGKGMTWNA